jgi:hypothetical protein
MSYQFAPQGLIIQNAMYYNMDVTGHLQNHVNSNGGKIHIANGTQYNDFFGRDPAPGVGKQLVITYRDGPHGQEHRATFNEGQAVDIAPQPQQQQFAPQGLIIQNAMYYNMDVTAHLQKHIAGNGGKLHIAHGTQYNDMFGRDPAPGVGKQLVITYRDGPYGQEQRATFNECQAVDLKPSQQQQQPQQLAPQGLIIQNAMYYNMDVTSHLQKHVAGNGGKLHIAHGTQYNDMFGRDPAPGVGKQLVITYRDGPYGQEQRATFNECQAVDIAPQPQQQQVYPQQQQSFSNQYVNVSVSQSYPPQVAVTESGFFGGSGGSHFSSYNPSLGPVTIQNVIVHAGTMLDSLQIVFSNGQSSQRFGGGGGTRHDVNLSYGESIVRVDVRSGSLVDSVAFTTNTGRTFGPFGGSGGNHHYAVAQPGQQLIGLKGRGGTLIDAVNAVFGGNAAQMTP